MKKLFYPALAVAILVACAFTILNAPEWAIKDNFSVKFSGTDIEGVFKTMTGSINFDENDPASSAFDVTIDVKSINTGNGMKNKHAEGEKWFDAARTPNIKFTSNNITKTPKGYEAKGTLEMRGVKKPLTIPFNFKKNGTDGEFAGAFEVNRTEFFVGSAGGKVSDIIKLEVTVPVSPK